MKIKIGPLTIQVEWGETLLERTARGGMEAVKAMQYAWKVEQHNREIIAAAAKGEPEFDILETAAFYTTTGWAEKAAGMIQRLREQYIWEKALHPEEAQPVAVIPSYGYPVERIVTRQGVQL